MDKKKSQEGRKKSKISRRSFIKGIVGVVAAGSVGGAIYISQTNKKVETRVAVPRLSENLFKSLLGKINLLLTGGDDTAPPDKNHFVTWCTPGIPFQNDDLLFLQKGIQGNDASETARLIDQAASLARLVDFIPDVNGVYGLDQQTMTFEPSGASLSQTYSNILRFSEVANGNLGANEKAKLEKFRNMLSTTKKVRDSITGKIIEEQVDGPIMRAYKQYESDYVSAALEYNSKRLAALSADSPRAVQEWAINATLYRQKVRSAHGAWVTQGYKNDVEQIQAYIDQVTLKDMKLLKADLLDGLKRLKMSSVSSNQDFYYTTLLPGTFYTGKDGWTEVSFEARNVEVYSKADITKWGTEAGFNCGVYGFKREAGSPRRMEKYSFDLPDFKMSFRMTQVQISRPWFSPEFLTSKAWRFSKDSDMKILSDGMEPPSGQCIAYPSRAVFVRDVKIESSEINQLKAIYEKELKSSGGLSIGAFRLGGNYSRGLGERRLNSHFEQESLTVEGMQLIAFKCRILPKSPDPLASITTWA